jgi:uncharacterized protein (DUF983 family)
MDVTGPDTETVMTRPPFTTVLSRAIRLQCPRCAQSLLFETWLRMTKQCPNCQLKYERDAGYFLGSTYLNYGLTSFISTVSYVVLHFGYGISNQTLTIGLLTFVGIFPLFFFRYARSLWLGIDCYVDPTGVYTNPNE